LLLYDNLTPQLAAVILISALIGMTIHEFAHNYVAHLMGDPTPSRLGHLTLDPLKHIYWPGFIMFVLIGFGILGLAPINPSLMRNPRWGGLAATAAGPFSNLLLGAVLAIIYHLVGDVNELLSFFLLHMVLWNVLLFVFNLIPLYPIDGWHIVLALLPPEQAIWWERNAQTTQLVFIGLLLLSFVRLPGVPDVFGLLIWDPTVFILNVLGMPF
jgi:Zn-dependent protease